MSKYNRHNHEEAYFNYRMMKAATEDSTIAAGYLIGWLVGLGITFLIFSPILSILF